jgi:hypothetical protein
VKRALRSRLEAAVRPSLAFYHTPLEVDRMAAMVKALSAEVAMPGVLKHRHRTRSPQFEAQRIQRVTQTIAAMQ